MTPADGRRAGTRLVRPGWVDEHEPDRLPGPDLGRPVDIGVQHDRRHRVAAGDRVVGEEQHRLAARRDLDGAADHALAGQLAGRGARSSGARRRGAARRGCCRLDAVQAVAVSAPTASVEPVVARAGATARARPCRPAGAAPAATSTPALAAGSGRPAAASPGGQPGRAEAGQHVGGCASPAPASTSMPPRTAR